MIKDRIVLTLAFWLGFGLAWLRLWLGLAWLCLGSGLALPRPCLPLFGFCSGVFFVGLWLWLSFFFVWLCFGFGCGIFNKIIIILGSNNI